MPRRWCEKTSSSAMLGVVEADERGQSSNDGRTRRQSAGWKLLTALSRNRKFNIS